MRWSEKGRPPRLNRDSRGGVPPGFYNQKEGWVQTLPAPDVTGAGDQGATGGPNVGRTLRAETM